MEDDSLLFVNTVKAHYESTINLLKKGKMPFTVIRSGNMREVLFPNGTTKKYFVSMDRMLGVHLVKMVQYDIKKRISAGEYTIESNPSLVSSEYNLSSFYTMFNHRGFRVVRDEYDGLMIGVDINRCYWNTLHIIKAISTDLYKKGMANDDYKLACNCAVGSLNKKRDITFFDKNGVEIKDKHTCSVGDLSGVRYDVLVFVYKMAVDIARRLGDKFCYFATDCFYVTPDAVGEVQKYIAEYGYMSKIKPEKVESFITLNKNNYVLKWRKGKSNTGDVCVNYFNKNNHIDNQ